MGRRWEMGVGDGSRSRRPARWRPYRCRGATLLIVMVVVGVAAVMGYAMLSAGTLQSMSARGNLNGTTAEYLADSGAQAALYYIQNPGNSPVALVGGKYPGQNGMTFGAAAGGTADVTVGYADGKYTVVSKGYATSTDGTTYTKTVTVVAELVSTYTPKDAAQFGNDVNLNKVIINGPVEVNGTMSTTMNSKILLGPTRATSLSGAGLVSGWSSWGSGEGTAVPRYADLKDFTGTYKWLGRTYSAKKITATSLTAQVLPAVADLLTNPAGVYYTEGDLDLNALNVITGTLIVRGKLTVKGAANVIVAKPGFPALVVKNDIQMTGLAPSLAATGLVFTDKGVKAGPSASMFSVVGAFVAAGSMGIDPAGGGNVTLTYDVTKLLVPDLTAVGAVVSGVRVVSWGIN